MEELGGFKSASKNYVLNGYRYYAKKRPNKTYLYCVLKSCLAGFKVNGNLLVTNGRRHNHVRDDNQITYLRYRNALRKAALTCSNAAERRAAFKRIKRRHQYAAQFVSYNKIKSFMWRVYKSQDATKRLGTAKSNSSDGIEASGEAGPSNSVYNNVGSSIIENQNMLEYSTNTSSLPNNEASLTVTHQNMLEYSTNTGILFNNGGSLVMITSTGNICNNSLTISNSGNLYNNEASLTGTSTSNLCNNQASMGMISNTGNLCDNQASLAMISNTGNLYNNKASLSRTSTGNVCHNEPSLTIRNQNTLEFRTCANNQYDHGFIDTVSPGVTIKQEYVDPETDDHDSIDTVGRDKIIKQEYMEPKVIVKEEGRPLSTVGEAPDFESVFVGPTKVEDGDTQDHQEFKTEADDAVLVQEAVYSNDIASETLRNSGSLGQYPILTSSPVSCSGAPTISVVTTFPSSVTTTTVSAISGLISTTRMMAGSIQNRLLPPLMPPSISNNAMTQSISNIGNNVQPPLMPPSTLSNAVAQSITNIGNNLQPPFMPPSTSSNAMTQSITNIGNNLQPALMRPSTTQNAMVQSITNIGNSLQQPFFPTSISNNAMTQSITNLGNSLQQPLMTSSISKNAMTQPITNVGNSLQQPLVLPSISNNTMTQPITNIGNNLQQSLMPPMSSSNMIQSLPTLGNSLQQPLMAPNLANLMTQTVTGNSIDATQQFLYFNPQGGAPSIVMLPPQQSIIQSPSIIVPPLSAEMHQNTLTGPIGTSNPVQTSMKGILPLTPTQADPTQSIIPLTQTSQQEPNIQQNYHSKLTFFPTKADDYYVERGNTIKIDLTSIPEALKKGVKAKVKELCDAMFLKKAKPWDIIIAFPLYG